VEIDFLKREDVDEVTALEVAASSRPWGRAVLVRDLAAPDGRVIYLGGRSREGLLGFAVLGREGRTALLMNLVVVLEARRWGIGSQLLLACSEVAKEWGARQMRLHVREGNQPALALYFRFGFAPEGGREKVYRDGEAALTMSAPLPFRIEGEP
jgi:ribosomal-protein-alanine N-acetyltransferase